jgi:sec1 family domain-containing protein 1
LLTSPYRTKIVESIMDPSTASSSAIAKTENYLYFDPRHAHARGAMPPPSSRGPGGTAPGGLPGSGLGVQGPGTGATFGQRRQGFSEALVFVVGGGSMTEYNNLMDWSARTGGERAKRRVIYGSEFLVSSQDFIKEELERLGREV